jgi:hypothetical protein
MVNQKAQEAVQKNLDGVTSDSSTGVAGMSFMNYYSTGEQ